MAACGGGSSWSLKLALQDGQDPELVVLIRLDDASRGQDPDIPLHFSSNVSLPPEGFDGSFNVEDYASILRGCALEQGLVQNPDHLGADFAPPPNSCIQLGEYFGQDVFGGVPVSLEVPQMNSSITLQSDTSFVFVVVFYTTGSDFGNCLQLRLVEVIKGGFRVKTNGDFIVTSSIEVELEAPASGNCYLL